MSGKNVRKRNRKLISWIFSIAVLFPLIATANQATKLPLNDKLAASLPSPGEGYATFARDTGITRVDVADRFSAWERTDPSSGRSQVRFLISDGSGSIYSCAAGDVPRAGQPRDTEVTFEYENKPTSGLIQASVTRTLNFDTRGNSKTYQFGFDPSKTDSITLEPGIEFTHDNGEINYRQTIGPIGANGARRLELSFNLDRTNEFSGLTTIDSDAWVFLANKDASEAKINMIEVGDLETTGAKPIPSIHSLSMTPVATTRQNPSALVNSFITNTEIICPIGSCFGQPRVACRLSGVPVAGCWCPDGITCVVIR